MYEGTLKAFKIRHSRNQNKGLNLGERHLAFLSVAASLSKRLYHCGRHVSFIPEDGSALPPHGPAAVHDEDVGGEAEDVGRVERQVLVVGTAAGG